METEQNTTTTPTTPVSSVSMSPSSQPAHTSRLPLALFNTTPMAVVVGAAIIAGAILWSPTRTPIAQPSPTQTTDAKPAIAVDSSKVKVDNEPFIGNADAPVTIAFWTDYQCPFCKAVEYGGIPQIPTQPAFPDIIKNYVDTGKAKIVFKDFPFLGNDSITAALYGRAVWELYPDQYFLWRTAMYKAQDQEGDQGFGDAASIDILNATIPGFNAAKITAAVAAKGAVYKTAIEADQQEGTSFGVNGTPGTIIGTQFVNGAQSYAAFAAAIDAALAAIK